MKLILPTYQKLSSGRNKQGLFLKFTRLIPLIIKKINKVFAF